MLANGSGSMRSAESLPACDWESRTINRTWKKRKDGEEGGGGEVPISPCEHEVRLITLCSAKLLTQFRCLADRQVSTRGANQTVDSSVAQRYQ